MPVFKMELLMADILLIIPSITGLNAFKDNLVICCMFPFNDL